ncbi:hypothetical protein HQ531_03430 [bacterium]|nr:hypothetical protein [bacterium]
MTNDQTLFGMDLTGSHKTMAKALTRAIRSCTYSRDQLATMLSLSLGRRITIHILNNITSISKPHYADINLVKAICAITGDARPIELFLEGLGHQLVHKEEVPIYEMHKLLMERKRIDDRLESLEGQINNGSK